MTINSKLFQGPVLFSLIEILQRGSTIAAIPILTLALAPKDYGLISANIAIYSLLVVFISMGMNSAVGRNFHIYGDKGQLDAFLSTSFLSSFILSAFVMFISLLFGEGLFEGLFKGVIFEPFVIFTIVTTFLDVTILNFGEVLKQKNQSKQYFIFFSLFISSRLLLLIIFYLFNNLSDPLYYFYIYLCVSAFFFIIAISSIFFQLKIRLTVIKLDVVKSNLMFALPLIPINVFGYLNFALDKVFITQFLSLASLGIYSISAQIGNLVNMLSSAFTKGITPRIYKLYQYSREDSLSVLENLSNQMILNYVVISGIIAVNGKYLLTFFKAEYYSGYEIIPVFAVNGAVMGAYYFTSLMLSLKVEFASLKIIPTIMGVLVNFALNYLLISRFGLMGAALASLAGSVVSYVIGSLFCKFIYGVSVAFRVVVISLILYSAVYFVSRQNKLLFDVLLTLILSAYGLSLVVKSRKIFGQILSNDGEIS